MTDEWEFFPEIKWVDSFWGVSDEVENPVLVERRSLDAVIKKTDELLETALPGQESELEDTLVTFMDDAFGPDVKLGSDKYRRDLVERESEIVELFASTAPMSGVEYIPGDAVAFTKNTRYLREKFLPFESTEIGKYLITLYDDFYMEAQIDSMQPMRRTPKPGTPAMVCFNATMAMDCIIQGVTKDPDIYKISYLDITSYERENIRVHFSRIAAPFGYNLISMENLEPADFRVWKPTMIINGTPQILNRYPLYLSGTAVNTLDGQGEIVSGYDANPEYPDKYGVRLVGKSRTDYFEVWEFQVENPNTEKWKEFNAKLDKLYRHSKEGKSPPPTPPSSPSVPPPKFDFEIGDIVKTTRNSGEWQLKAYYQDRWFADMIGHSESGNFDDSQLTFIRRPLPTIPEKEEPAPTKRRRLMDEGDIRWWDDRRYFWQYRSETLPYPVNRANKLRGKDTHGGIFVIPDFAGKILMTEDAPNQPFKSWEMLNVYVDELLDTKGFSIVTDIEVDLYPRDDVLRSARVSQEDLFSKRMTDDPSYGWTIADDKDGEIYDHQGEYSPDDISGLWWLWNAIFDKHTTDDYDEDDKTFWKILNTIAGSRTESDWLDPYEDIEHTDAHFRMLYNRASNLITALNFHLGIGNYYYGGTEFAGLRTMRRLQDELNACIEVAARLWGRALVPTDYGESKVLDSFLPYRRNFKFDGTEMYWEIFDVLPRPTAEDYSSQLTIEKFIRDRWLPYFREWPYADKIEPDEFLKGKSAWDSDLQHASIRLNLDGSDKDYLFMTPDENVVSQNVHLMGLTNPDRRRTRWSMPDDGKPEMFMTAYYTVLHGGPAIETFPTLSPNLRNLKFPNLRVYNMENSQEIHMAPPRHVVYGGGGGGGGAGKASGGGGGGAAIIVLVALAAIGFSYSK